MLTVVDSWGATILTFFSPENARKEFSLAFNENNGKNAQIISRVFIFLRLSFQSQYLATGIRLAFFLQTIICSPKI